MNIYVKAGDPDDISLGRALIASGKVGCIVLAGGDGSRLGWSGPKGTFPLSLVKQKSLFQLLHERALAASKSFGQELKVAVMTSPINYAITRKALPESIDLFNQEMIPLLDRDQKPLEEMRPNGNGEVLKRFFQSGLYEKWKKSGIEYVQVILIDNPLAEPFDPNQIGIHYKKGAQVTLKAIKKLYPEEKVGVIGKIDGKVRIVEYSDAPPKDWTLANTSLFCFSMDFIKKAQDVQLPLHLVRKVINGMSVFKKECFIFDLLPHAEKVDVILCDRKKIFAPLKERSDVGRVQRALLDRDRMAYESITGHDPGEHIFELDASFHYPTELNLQKWRDRPFAGGSYIEG